MNLRIARNFKKTGGVSGLWNLSLLLSAFMAPMSCHYKAKHVYSEAAYQYPVKPGTEEWKNSKGPVDCQIPEQILQRLSTAALIESVLDYPLFSNVWWTRGNMRQGFAHMFAEFNGVRELFDRKDAAGLLLAKYSSVDPAGFRKGASMKERDEYVMRVQEVEILLAQEVIRSGLTEIQLEALTTMAYAKYEIKKTLGDYGTMDKELLLLLTTGASQDVYPNIP